MPEFGPLPNSLRRAVTRLSRQLRRNNDFTELSFPQVSALGILLAHGSMTLQELAEREGITPPSMLKSVQRLIELEYVGKAPHETDGRKQLLTITERGHEVIDDIRERRNEWLRARLDALSPEEIDVLEQALPILFRLAERDV
ncbi:MAG: MarR family winged helix-turn-helix transcriptional regulator [Agrococcus casei]|uniref:MarR family winged helix-turn-helix transcriptional regulator n=1 Tax=Agrococcus casei TaxID=343512 RepID=UPI000B352295|nr:MarR family transcriptional regulator [Agrococcus casei]